MDTNLPPEAVPFYGLQAVNRFTAVMGTAHETEFMPACIDGLREWLDRRQHFKDNTIIAKQFLDELDTHLYQCRPVGGIPDYALCDVALFIIECLATIFREDQLKQPTRQMSAAQATLLQFFEENAQWNKGDGQLVTDYYYFAIPNEVENP